MWFDETRELLGSQLRITFEHSDYFVARSLLDSSWERIGDFQKKYSRFLSGNVLEKINERIGEWQRIDVETFGHFRRVRDLEDRYPLNFSLAVKTVLERMGYDSNYSFREKDGVGDGRDCAQDFLLRGEDEVFLYAPVEFGGFGKGYALDMVVAILKHECRNICLDFGGDLYAKGLNEKGEAWKMALESPFVLDEAIGLVELNGAFLAGSNTLKRRWGREGKYHHLVDPKTVRSADYWAGVFVMAHSGMEADFLATALFCADANTVSTASKNLSESLFLLVDLHGGIHNHDFPGVLFSE